TVVAAVAGSMSCAREPQPRLARCWNSPTESWSYPTPWFGNFNESGTYGLARLRSSLSWSVVLIATRCARAGNPILRPTPTMTTALSICDWLRPATGCGGGGGGGGDGGGGGGAGTADGVAGAEVAGLRAYPRETSSGMDREPPVSTAAAARTALAGAAWRVTIAVTTMSTRTMLAARPTIS